jgi:putative GTP pyrophosphokinase
MAPRRTPFQTVSRSQVDKAGVWLRKWYGGKLNFPADFEDFPQELLDAMVTVFHGYRPTFQSPMDKVHVQLSRWAIQISGNPAAGRRVGQRLKRESQILDKLYRLPTIRLSTMQDIGGCRVVLDDGTQVATLVAKIQKNWRVIGAPDDYAENPTRFGYRAVHVVVERDGRLIEIQIRTPRQQEWAIAVERTGNRLRMPLKFGEGPPELLRYFERAAYGMALEERGAEPEQAFVKEFDELREQVRPHFRRK